MAAYTSNLHVRPIIVIWTYEQKWRIIVAYMLNSITLKRICCAEPFRNLCVALSHCKRYMLCRITPNHICCTKPFRNVCAVLRYFERVCCAESLQNVYVVSNCIETCVLRWRHLYLDIMNKSYEKPLPRNHEQNASPLPKHHAQIASYTPTQKPRKYSINRLYIEIMNK